MNRLGPLRPKSLTRWSHGPRYFLGPCPLARQMSSGHLADHVMCSRLLPMSFGQLCGFWPLSMKCASHHVLMRAALLAVLLDSGRRLQNDQSRSLVKVSALQKYNP